MQFFLSRHAVAQDPARTGDHGRGCLVTSRFDSQQAIVGGLVDGHGSVVDGSIHEEPRRVRIRCSTRGHSVTATRSASGFASAISGSMRINDFSSASRNASSQSSSATKSNRHTSAMRVASWTWKSKPRGKRKRRSSEDFGSRVRRMISRHRSCPDRVSLGYLSAISVWV